MSYRDTKTVFREFSSAGEPYLRVGSRVLVERDAEQGWVKVAPGDRVVNTDELGRKLGLWRDEKITKGHLWLKETLRLLDGKIDADKVVPFG